MCHNASENNIQGWFKRNQFRDTTAIGHRVLRKSAGPSGRGRGARTHYAGAPPHSNNEATAYLGRTRSRRKSARYFSPPRPLLFRNAPPPPPKPLVLLLKAGRTSVAAKTDFRMVSRASPPRAALLLLWAAMAGLLLLSRAAALTVNAVQPSATEQLKEDNPGVTLNTTSLENDPVSQMLVPEVGQMEQSLYGRR